MESEGAAWQRAAVHQHTRNPDEGPAVEINGGQPASATEIQNARGKFGHDEQWWDRLSPVGEQRFQLLCAGFQGVNRFEFVDAIIEVEADLWQLGAGRIGGSQPTEIGISID